MQNNKPIHSLAAPNSKSGMIRFIHKDGKQHIFCTCINKLTGDRMSWFDDNVPSSTIGAMVALLAAGECCPRCSYESHDMRGKATGPVKSKSIKIGRNDPCHCGSGKKFKNCCRSYP